jgi:hypothetical protein
MGSQLPALGTLPSTLLTLTWKSRDRLFEVQRNRILTELRDHKIEQRNSYGDGWR